MKIAIVSRGYSSQKGGAERFTLSFLSQLIEKGHEVHLFSAENTGISIKNVVFRPVKFSSFFSSLKILSFHRAIRSIIEKEKFDIVYGLCQFFPLNFFYAGGGVHRHWMRLCYPNNLLRKIKYVINPVHAAMVYLEDNIFSKNQNNVIITNSQLVQKHVIQYYDVSPDKVRVIYDGIDHNIFNPDLKEKNLHLRKKLTFKDNDIVILFASNNWKRKGLSTILKSLRNLPLEFKLLVVGKGKPGKFLKNYDTLRERVFFTGVKNDIENYYGISDIFVLPTQYDPFSQVCKESMACGVPVITTLSNGASEVIEHQKNGFILESWDDFENLTKYLMTLKDCNYLKKLGENAYIKSKEFSWEKNAREHLELFQKYANTY